MVITRCFWSARRAAAQSISEAKQVRKKLASRVGAFYKRQLIPVFQLDFSYLFTCLIFVRESWQGGAGVWGRPRQRAHLGHDWSADQFIEKHGSEESEFRQGNGQMKTLEVSFTFFSILSE